MDAVPDKVDRIGQIQAGLASLTPAPAPATTAPPVFTRMLQIAIERVASSSAPSRSTSPSTPPPTAPSTSPSTSPSTAASSGVAWNRAAAFPARPSGLATGGLNAAGIPVDLAAYGNGKVPPAALRPIGHHGHRLWAPAADAFTAIEAAAARDGVRLGVTDSYRTYAAQVDLVDRKGLYSQGGLAARPGTSDHGWGRSLDLDLNDRAQAWIRKHGREYGFVEDVPREPWHWTFSPTR